MPLFSEIGAPFAQRTGPGVRPNLFHLWTPQRGKGWESGRCLSLIRLDLVDALDQVRLLPRCITTTSDKNNDENDQVLRCETIVHT